MRVLIYLSSSSINVNMLHDDNVIIRELITNLQTLFQFYQRPADVLFSGPEPVPQFITAVVVMPPQILPSLAIPVFLCLITDNFDTSENNQPVCFTLLCFSDILEFVINTCFLLIKLKLQIFDKNNTEVMFSLPSTPYQEVHDVDMSYDNDINFDHLVVPARFFYVKLLFFPL